MMTKVLGQMGFDEVLNPWPAWECRQWEPTYGPGDGTYWPERVWSGVVCSHCGGDRYGHPFSTFADACLDCGKVGYRAVE